MNQFQTVFGRSFRIQLSATILLLCFFILLLLFPQASAAGASAGLLLWYQNVLPVLFPAMLLMTLIIRLGMLKKLIPFPAVFCFLAGLLCGYPMGAGCCRELYQEGLLTDEQLNRLLPAVNFPSPMLITGILFHRCLPFLTQERLQLAVLLPAFLLTLLAYRLPPACRHCSKGASLSQPASPRSTANAALPTAPSSRLELSELFLSCCRTMVIIGVYLMLFSCLNGILLQLSFPELPALLLCGLLEMTSGILQTASCSLPLPWKAALALFFACFGGCSVFLQLISQTEGLPCHPGRILLFRFLHGLLAAVLGVLFVMIS